MANYKYYNQHQTFLQAIDPLVFRENNGLLRVIDEFVDEHLPIGKFSEAVHNDEVGAAALDPRLVTKVLFYAIATGVRSYRSIEDRLNWDPAFMILSAQETIDHSTLCRFIDRHWKALREFFTLMVYILIEEGYMTKEFFGTDGTKIKACAGKDFTGTYEDFLRRSKKLENKIEEILSKMGNDNPDPEKPRKLRTLQKKKEKIDKFLEEVKNNPGQIGSKQKVNLTDPDARMMKDKDTSYPGYNLLLTVDANHFIATYGLFTCTADQPHLKPMVNKLREQINDPLKDSILGFDAGFFSGENLLFLEQKQLNAYIPAGQAEDGSKKFKDKTKITSKDCKLENIDGVPLLTCPGKQSMVGKQYRCKSGRTSYGFRPNREECRSCSLMQRCYGKQRWKYFEVEKITFDSVDARERMKQKVASDFGRKIRNQRFSTGEHINGEIKDQMRFRQFHHRGKNKVETIAAIIATAYNFRRLAAVS
jgi:transposase